MSHGPLEFRAVVEWDGETGGVASLPGSSTELRVDMPVEFGGGSRYPCPDEVFLASIGGCLLTTFLYIRRKMGFRLEGLRIEVVGVVDSSGPEGYRVSRVDAHMHVYVGRGDGGLAERCAELASEYCHITRTLEEAIPVEVSWTVSER